MTKRDVERWGLHDTDQITVCSECSRACCWLGVVMCDDARDADVKSISIAEAKKLKLEHSDYWIQLRKEEGYRAAP